MQIATVFGIPLRLHWSFFGLMGLMALWGFWSQGLVGVPIALFAAVALFGSVALHEFGHAYAASRYGIRTRSVTLFPFGGVAAIERMPRNPRQELVIALAGPAVNFVLAAGFGALAFVTASQIVGILAAMNVGMGLFNLIPAYPMDGGRVLRALLTPRFGWYRATDIAIRGGTFFAWVFILVGVLWVLPSLVLVGAFLHFALVGERARLKAQAFEDLSRGRYSDDSWPKGTTWTSSRGFGGGRASVYRG